MLNNEQKEVARDFVKRRIYNEIDQKREVKATQYRPDLSAQWKTAEVKERKQKENNLDNWMQLFSATTMSGKNAAKASILGSDKAIQSGLEDIVFTKDNAGNPTGATLIYKDKSLNRPMDLSTTTSAVDWAREGLEFHGVEDPNMYNKYKNTTLGNNTSFEWDEIQSGRAGQTARTIVKTPKAVEAVTNYVDQQSDALTSAISMSDEKEANSDLESIISKLGIKSNRFGYSATNNGTTLSKTIKKGVTKSIKIYFNTSDPEAELEKLKGFISAVTSEADAQNLINAKVIAAPAPTE
jgi:hypothetical protein